MASVIAHTTLDLDPAQKKAFIKDLGLGITDGLGIAPNLYGMMWVSMPKVDLDDGLADGKPETLNLFAYSAAGKTIEQKRAMVKNAFDVVERYFGAGKVNLIIIIKDHDDENVGINGRLRLDIKAEQAAKK